MKIDYYFAEMFLVKKNTTSLWLLMQKDKDNGIIIKGINHIFAMCPG